MKLICTGSHLRNPLHAVTSPPVQRVTCAPSLCTVTSTCTIAQLVTLHRCNHALRYILELFQERNLELSVDLLRSPRVKLVQIFLRHHPLLPAEKPLFMIVELVLLCILNLFYPTMYIISLHDVHVSH